jgi:NADPH:quinone reductase-like Zn-dependent oxidoreductase
VGNAHAGGLSGRALLDHDPAQTRCLSELRPGRTADYVAVPKRNALPIPEGLSTLDASLLGTVWLTAYRSLFTKARLMPGQIVLVQGASGGMSTALIQLPRAAAIHVWVATRNDKGAEIAETLAANRIFRHGETLPGRVDAVVDNVGTGIRYHSLKSVKRGGVVVINAIVSGHMAETNLVPIFVEQLDARGTIMGTLDEMHEKLRPVIPTQLFKTQLEH